MPILLDKIWDLKRSLRHRGLRINLPELMVLSRSTDPYLLQDGIAGQWFADQVAKFLKPGQVIHLRGLFYLCVAAGNVIYPRSREMLEFVNTHEVWKWFTKVAAKNARWLGKVDFALITDERNAPPEEYVKALGQTWHWVSTPRRCETPYFTLPKFVASVAANQPYRIILIGEKVSLKSFLLPIAEEVDGDLYLPTGEISDTQIGELAARCEEDGRPAVILYFSDFDPSGWQMPISVAYKLQALRDLHNYTFQIEVHHVGLTKEQAIEWKLPSTPLKDKEKRGKKWKEVMGREQTEIDAAIALQPDKLRALAEAAVRPFYDATLASRAREIGNAWEQKVAESLKNNHDFQRPCDIVKRHVEYADRVLQKLAGSQTYAGDILRDIPDEDLPKLEEPEPELPDNKPEPLYSSEWDHYETIQRMRSYRAYEFDEDDEE